MNVLALALGVYLVFLLLDRMRLISWRTTKHEYVALYLAQTLWAVGIVNDAVTGRVEFYQLGALISTLIWIHLTRQSWKAGAPDHILTEPAPLGPPEIPTWK